MGCWRAGAALALLGLLVAATPVAAGVFNPESFTLKNGLRVVVISNHRLPIAVHTMWYRVGAIDQPPGKSGLAHFLEHMMFKGTTKVPAGEFSRIVARNGGNDNAFTTQDYSIYMQKIAVDRLDLAMSLEADRMTNLAITDNEVVPERDVVIEERRSRIDNNPVAQLREHMAAVLYLNHPYRIPAVGWKRELESIVTADALDFYRRFYVPNNAVLVVAGDITLAEIKPMAEKHYGSISARVLPSRPIWAEPPQRASRRVLMRSAEARQPFWSKNYLAPGHVAGDTKHAYALEVLAELLGGGPTSRLYRSLAVTGKLVTDAGVSYDPVRRGPPQFSFYATPRAKVAIAAVEAATEAEIALLLARGVTGEEVDRAKRRLQVSAIFARDSLSHGAFLIGAAEMLGLGAEYVETWPARIGAVTVEAVNAAARAVLKDTGSVVSILVAEGRGK